MAAPAALAAASRPAPVPPDGPYRSDQTGAALPVLAPPTAQQLALAALALTGAAALLVLLAVRLAAGVRTAEWWLPLALLAGVVAADVVSGLVHWAADTWGRADLPVVGPRLLVPFRVHHVNPDDFLRRGFLHANGDTAVLAVPVLAALQWLPLDAAWGRAAGFAGLGFCGVGILTNQIHQWAHRPGRPRVVTALQRAGLLLRPRDHARHHAHPWQDAYCITTGWCNRPLEAIGFFRRLESLVIRTTGAVPRRDERDAVRAAAPERTA